jgi:hypothetical protein
MRALPFRIHLSRASLGMTIKLSFGHDIRKAHAMQHLVRLVDARFYVGVHLRGALNQFFGHR